MHIQILGTAAAEAWPALFCGCETCRRARATGGYNFRSRASIQIDDVYKIDFPPDSYHHLARWSLDFSRIEHLFFTHSHEDHFALRELAYLRPPFAHNLASPPVRIYGSSTVTSAVEEHFGSLVMPIELVTLSAFEPVAAGELTFTPIVARHKPTEECFNYVVSSDSGAFLYACDTGVYDRPTTDFLRSARLDLLIVECTQGTLDMPATSHMSFEAVLDLRNTLIDSGAVRPDVPVVVTHFSHNMGLLHEEFQAIAGPEGVRVAYDGMELTC